MLLKGNCLETLKTLDTSSVDSIVTDPPYELGFMGKSWDNSGIAYSTELWAECLRVLKPGGHLLAFGGSRTYHRLVVAIEDSGFEIRDQIMWLYGSGFPKSLNVSKAIDKRGGADISWFGGWLKQEREKRGISRKELAQHFPSQQAYGGKPASGNTTGCVGNWETGVSVPTNEQFNKLCEILDLPFAKLEEAEREVIKERTMVQGGGNALQMRVGERREVEANITAPATPKAQQWEGWGTALKPSHEPIVVARKPLIGTVANNVLTYGTGALNIDGSRVGMTQSDANKSSGNWKPQGYKVGENIYELGTKVIATEQSAQGRWPANVIITHSHSCEQVGETGETIVTTSGKGFAGSFEGGTNDNGGASQTFSTPVWKCVEGCPTLGFPNTTSGKPAGRKNIGNGYHGNFGSIEVTGFGDSGSAARFFYCAKASKSERNAGLEGLPERGKVFNGQSDEPAGNAEGSVEDKFSTKPAQNFHPTVKPLALMRYLVKLVTPPNGIVLDPFLGSGTTAVAATLEGFEWIGCEMTEEYFPIIEARVEWAQNERNTEKATPTLFERGEKL